MTGAENLGPLTRLAVRGHDDPPTAWCIWWADVTRLTDEIFYGWPDGETNPWFWHWCTRVELWRAQGTGDHDLVSREPLHLEPSLWWQCCGLHGWCRNSEWTPA